MICRICEERVEVKDMRSHRAEGCSRPTNTCDSCGTTKLEPDTALCGACADDAWDRWLDRHDDIGPDE